MFSSLSQIRKRTPQNGTDRESFLSLLVDEYVNSTSYDAKCQVLANLANFAYDPVNYGYIRDVGVLDIFMYVLKNDSDQTLIHFASAGICNLCIDPDNAKYILQHTGLEPLISLLQSDHVETVANAITALIYLYNDQTKCQINNPTLVNSVKNLQQSEDQRLVNLSTIFLQDVCQCD